MVGGLHAINCSINSCKEPDLSGAESGLKPAFATWGHGDDAGLQKMSF